ncbi:beta-class carbonic anhydrase [Phosphitispora sp. TUW77]|uniref:beta-class carbonic anhydrase n=1 Tax=Phosphitispora sp. TUW77 TaxID=3152361 RepID=UPI003AB5C6A3
MLLEEILLANSRFVTEYGDLQKKYGPKPRKKVAIFTCMDTRLVEFLEQALGISRGDAKVIKNAGNRIREDCDDVIRSLAVAIYLLGVREILVIGHLHCGMSKLNTELLAERMKEFGIPEEEIDKDDLAAWMGSFSDTEENVVDAVDKIKSHRLIPRSIPVHGLIFCPDNGELQVLVNGYKQAK